MANKVSDPLRFIPSAEAIRDRLTAVMEEARRLGVLLKTAEEIERSRKPSPTSGTDLDDDRLRQRSRARVKTRKGKEMHDPNDYPSRAEEQHYQDWADTTPESIPEPDEPELVYRSHWGEPDGKYWMIGPIGCCSMWAVRGGLESAIELIDTMADKRGRWQGLQ